MGFGGALGVALDARVPEDRKAALCEWLLMAGSAPS
jgi:hypothetical protein